MRSCRDRVVGFQSPEPQSIGVPDKFVFDFSEGGKDQKDLLDGKGANLAEMVRMGLPVTPGFTISTEACRAYLAAVTVPAGLDAEVVEVRAALEVAAGKTSASRTTGCWCRCGTGAKFSGRDDGTPDRSWSRYKHRGRTSTRQQRLT